MKFQCNQKIVKNLIRIWKLLLELAWENFEVRFKLEQKSQAIEGFKNIKEKIPQPL